jgi:hypothetical protein
MNHTIPESYPGRRKRKFDLGAPTIVGTYDMLRIIGEIWDKRSGGRCLFIMPNGKDFEAIRTKIA